MTDIIPLLQQQPNFYALTPASTDNIKAAEKMLNLQFSSDYQEYVATFGVASFAGHELTGICKSKRLSVVEVTLEERKYNDVPDDWYVLEQANIDGIVLWQDCSGTVYQTTPSTKATRFCGSLAEYIALY